jgi:hypothetical protein
MNSWLAHLRSGDYLVVALAALFTASLFPLFWRSGPAERAVIRANGKVFAEVDLAVRKTLTVPGPLGNTLVRIEPGRARVLSDPGPRQYCVLQGWLTRSGDVALCAPNRVSLQIFGRNAAYDSLTY